MERPDSKQTLGGNYAGWEFDVGYLIVAVL